MTTAMVLVGVLAVLGLHYLGSRSRWPWLGAVVPVAFVGFVVVLAIRGDMGSVRDWLMAAMSLVMLLGLAEAGARARRQADPPAGNPGESTGAAS